jgi:predicted ArsR family transcriptional regulator
VAVPGKRPIEGAQVCQHHCPVQHVAEEFPQLCEAETQVFAELLGTHVQRLATIAHGDGVCTTFIPGLPAKNQSSPTQATRTQTPANAEQSEGASA